MKFLFFFIVHIKDVSQPVMCSYKAVKVFFEVWGLQGRVESAVHRVSLKVMHMYEIGKFLYTILVFHDDMTVLSPS